MAIRTFQSLFEDEVELLFSAESQIGKGLAVIAKAVVTEELAQLLDSQTKRAKVFSRSLQETVAPLDRKDPKSQDSVVKLLLKACADASKRFEKGNLRDAALLVGIHRLQLHQVAAYTSTLALAKQLGEEKLPEFLKEAMSFNDLAAKHCTQIALQVNAEAFIDTHSEKCVPTV